MIQVTIPGIPTSVNERWRPSRHGGYYTGRDTNQWQRDVVMLLGPHVSDALRVRWTAAVEAGAAIRITMTWHRPDRRRRDTSNTIKAIEDALADFLRIDDRHFEWTTFRAYDRRNPRVDLTLALEEVPCTSS